MQCSQLCSSATHTDCPTFCSRLECIRLALTTVTSIAHWFCGTVIYFTVVKGVWGCGGFTVPCVDVLTVRLNYSAAWCSIPSNAQRNVLELDAIYFGPVEKVVCWEGNLLDC